jgi:hypothetical protein
MLSVSFHELAERVRNLDFPVFVCGAGLSHGVAPLAQELKDGILSTVISVASHRQNMPPMHASTLCAREAQIPYFTLEMLVSFISYRAPKLREPLRCLYDKIFQLDACNSAQIAMARAFIAGHPSVILTSNFDDGLFKAITANGGTCRIITDANALGKTCEAGDVCAFHGSVYDRGGPDTGDRVSPPTSMTARGLAHPFIPATAEYIRTVLERSDGVFFLGYRGEDFYDLNVLIQQYISDGTSEDKVSRQKKFFVIPHLGHMDSLSDYIQNLAPSEHIIKIDGANNNWLTKICEEIAGKPSVSGEFRRIDAEVIESMFKDIIASCISEAELNSELITQNQMLLRDIASGVLSVWSVTEHYRLESLGFDQHAIRAFGRPPSTRTFNGISVRELIELQSRYWEFNRRIGNLSSVHDAVIVTRSFGNDLFNDFDDLNVAIESKLKTPLRAIESASCMLMKAICLDYMGLIAMKFEEKREAIASLRSRTGETPDSDKYFLASAHVAVAAKAELANDEAVLAIPDAMRTEYLAGLSQIVNADAWAMAAKENYARSDNRTLDEKVRLLTEAIEVRLKFIEPAADSRLIVEDASEFSVAGHAAQCVQRISELMRALAGVGPTGIPSFKPALSIPSAIEVMEYLEQKTDTCMRAAKNVSSISNPRFASGFDTLVLTALYRGRQDTARQWLDAAISYGQSEPRMSARLKQISSRLSG